MSGDGIEKNQPLKIRQLERALNKGYVSDSIQKLSIQIRVQSVLYRPDYDDLE